MHAGPWPRPATGLTACGASARRAECLCTATITTHRANEMVTVVCMIEDAGAVAQIDDILAVPGVDVAFIGPERPRQHARRAGRYRQPTPRPCCGGTAGGGCGQAGRGAYRDPLCGDGAEVARRIEQGMQWMPLASDVRVLRWGFDQQTRRGEGRSQPRQAATNREHFTRP